MLTWRLALLPLVLLAAELRAQSEVHLKQYFEGKRVTLKIAMPGTEEGVDIYPGTDRPLDYPRYASRLKDHGTAIRVGDDAMITKIRVRGRHIEFHLDGGGYGTFSDQTSSSVSVASTPKSKREKNLEAEVKREKDPVKKRQMNEELDDLRSEREREDARNRAEVADAEAQKEQNIRQRRLEGGSRFNVRYRDRLPDAVLTPTGLEAALAEYVAFDEQSRETLTVGAGDPPSPRPSGIPRKGMLAREVEEMLGEPLTTSERDEGKLKVVTRCYRSPDGGIVTAEFVEDVLFRYSVASN